MSDKESFKEIWKYSFSEENTNRKLSTGDKIKIVVYGIIGWVLIALLVLHFYFDLSLGEFYTLCLQKISDLNVFISDDIPRYFDAIIKDIKEAILVLLMLPLILLSFYVVIKVAWASLGSRPDSVSSGDAFFMEQERKRKGG